VYLSVYSKIFDATVSGNGPEAAAAELERAQLVKAGALGLMSQFDEESPVTLRGWRKKEEREAEKANQNYITQMMLMDAALEQLEADLDEADQSLVELRQRTEDRLDEINRLLDDPHAHLSDERRKRLEDERLRLQEYQDRLRDTQALIDEGHVRIAEGDFESPEEAKAFGDRVRDQVEQLKGDMPVNEMRLDNGQDAEVVASHAKPIEPTF